MPATSDVPGIEDQQWRGIGPFGHRKVQIWSFRFHLCTFRKPAKNEKPLKNYSWIPHSLRFFSCSTHRARHIHRMDISTWVRQSPQLHGFFDPKPGEEWGNPQVLDFKTWLMENKMSLSIQLIIYRTSYEKNSKNTLVELHDVKENMCFYEHVEKVEKRGPLRRSHWLRWLSNFAAVSSRRSQIRETFRSWVSHLWPPEAPHSHSTLWKIYRNINIWTQIWFL